MREDMSKNIRDLEVLFHCHDCRSITLVVFDSLARAISCKRPLCAAVFARTDSQPLELHKVAINFVSSEDAVIDISYLLQSYNRIQLY